MADLPKLRVVVFQEGEWWIAQFLEYYFLTMTESLEALPAEVERYLTVQVRCSTEHGVEPFTGFKPAPFRFWQMYQRGVPMASPYSSELRRYDGGQTKEALEETSLSSVSALGPFRQEDHARLPEKPRCELLYGRFYRCPSPTPTHQVAAAQICRRLEDVAAQTGGVALVAPLDTALAEHTVVQPDVLYVSRERRSSSVRGRIEGAPDLVVEVLAPETVRRDRGEKLRAYAELGVAEYWLVDTTVSWIDFLANRDGRFEVVLAFDGMYRSAFLLGVELNLSDLWEAIARGTQAT